MQYCIFVLIISKLIYKLWHVSSKWTALVYFTSSL